MYLRIKSNPVLFSLSRFFLDRDRLEALNALPESIVVHDLRKRLPFGDGSAEQFITPISCRPWIAT